MEALFQVKGVRHITIVDEDIDVFDDDEITWAMATRFNADKDISCRRASCRRSMPIPNADADGLVSKVGFD